MHYIAPHLRSLASSGNLLDHWARIVPFVLMAVPPIIVMGAEFPTVIHTAVWPILLACLWCAGLIARHLAENAERELWEKSQGRPGVRMLRHGDNCFPRKTKRMWHEHIKRKLHSPLPSAETERLDLRYADDAYSSALTHCEHHFQDPSRFRVLWQKRTGYEFLLNCFAVRWLGFVSAIGTPLFGCTRQPAMSLGTHAEADLTVLLAFDLPPAMTFVSCAFMAGLWLLFFTAERVNDAAWRHDHHMLECLAVHDDALPSRIGHPAKMRPLRRSG